MGLFKCTEQNAASGEGQRELTMAAAAQLLPWADSEDLPVPSVPSPLKQKCQQPAQGPVYLPGMVPWQGTPGCLLARTPEPLIICNFGKMFP